jgi:hypothetical protein
MGIWGGEPNSVYSGRFLINAHTPEQAVGVVSSLPEIVNEEIIAELIRLTSRVAPIVLMKILRNQDKSRVGQETVL